MALTSFFSALTGLNANSHTINTIGDNLANMNTIGFKAGKATFAEIIGGMSGFSATGNPMVFGQGALLNGIVHKQTQGTPEYTGNSTDAMIMGSGYFVVETGNGGIGYTRAGRFQFDKTGNLVSSDGYKLMGYMADESGKIDQAAGIKPIEIRMGQFVPASKTTEMSAAVNLDSQTNFSVTTAITIDGQLDIDLVDTDYPDYSFSVYDSAGERHDVVIKLTELDKSAGTCEWTVYVDDEELDDPIELAFDPTTGKITTPATATKDIELIEASSDPDDPPQLLVDFDFNNLKIIEDGNNKIAATPSPSPGVFVTPIEVYDSLGTQHVVQLWFTKTSEPGVNEPTWDLSAKLLLDNGTPKPYELEVDITGAGFTGKLEFDTSGKLMSTMPESLKLTIKAPSLVSNALPNNTMSGQTLTLDLRDVKGNSLITSAASESATSSTFQNGYAASNLASVAFDNNGVVIGIAANGNRMELAQLAIATFVNVEGLQKYNGSTLIASGNAGEPSIGVANSGSRGAINGGSLEMSNVDMSEEFINLIIAQRAFQANARVITTSDELYQEAIHLKR